MDRRIACIYIENFCFKSETIRQSFGDDDVVLIYATGQSKRYVVDVSKGVSPRMIGASLDFALEHYPDATLCEADFSYYHQEFYKILARIHSKTDQFQQAGLGIVYIDLHDLRNIFESEAVLTTALLNTVPSFMHPKIGISTGKYPAFLMAYTANSGQAQFVVGDVSGVIASVSVELLPVSRDIKYQLRRFGLNTLGDIASIPISGLQSQFGSVGVDIAEFSRGIDSSQIVPEKMPVLIEEVISFSLPISNIEVVSWGINNLLSKIMLHPAVQGKDIVKVTLGGVCVGGYTWSQKVIFKSSINLQKDLLDQILSKFKMLKLPNAIEELSLNVDVWELNLGLQKTLFPVQHDKRARIDRSIQILKTIQGNNPVHLIKGVDVCSRIPERRWAMVTYNS